METIELIERMVIVSAQPYYIKIQSLVDLLETNKKTAIIDKI